MDKKYLLMFLALFLMIVTVSCSFAEDSNVTAEDSLLTSPTPEYVDSAEDVYYDGPDEPLFVGTEYSLDNDLEGDELATDDSEENMTDDIVSDLPADELLDIAVDSSLDDTLGIQQLTLNDITAKKVTQNMKITGKVIDFDGTGIADSNITISIGAEVYGYNTFKSFEETTVQTDSEGVYKYTYKPKAAGEYNITVTSTEIHQTAFTNAYLQPKATNVTMDPIRQIYVGEKLNITGRLTDTSGNVLKSKGVGILIGGIPYGNYSYERYIKEYTRTDENGTFSYVYKPTLAGYTEVMVFYPGYYDYEFGYTQSSIYVLPKATKVNLNPISEVERGENLTITGNVTDKDNNPIRNKSVGLLIYGQKTYTRTDDTGSFTFNYTARYAGTVNATVYCLGYHRYGFSRNDTVLKITGNNSDLLDFPIDTSMIPGKPDLRFSVKWWSNETVYLDPYCYEPNSSIAGFSYSRNTTNGGIYEKDNCTSELEQVAIQNVYYNSKSLMTPGTYTFKVKKYNGEIPTIGFICEIEFDNHTYRYTYNQPLYLNDIIEVAKVTLNKGMFSINDTIPRI